MQKQTPEYRQKFIPNYVTTQVKPAAGAYSFKSYRRWAAGANRRFQDWFPADYAAPVLDLGCGPGNMLFLLHQAGYSNLIGVDLSPEQVEIARRACPQAEIIQGDAFDWLALHLSHYRLISALNIIEHFRKDEVLPFLDLIFNVLEPGGRLIVQTPNAASPWVGGVAYSDFTHEWFYSPRGLERLLTMVGFTAYQARESGPYIRGPASFVRFLAWQLIRAGLRVYDLVETGGADYPVYTRVFVASAVKPGESHG
jgi:SAM-dependent methyltransferase